MTDTESNKNVTMTPHPDSLCPDADYKIERLEHKPKSHNKDLHNDLSLQIKEKEEVYVPRDWVHSKLDQIKSSETLSVQSEVVHKTIKVNQNIISMDIETDLAQTASMEFHFFNDGIVKLNCINPANPSNFSFEMVDKPANLTPYDVEDHIVIESTHFDVTMTESEIKLVVNFNPFTVKILSIRADDTDKVLIEMNAAKSLVFDKNLTADFTFHTEGLYGLPIRSCDFRLEDTRRSLPYRFCNQDIPVYPIGSKNSLYGAIPVIVSRSLDSPTFVSMYWQNCSDTYIDIHKSESETKAYWLSERGNLECYFFVSHTNVQHYKSMSNVFGNCAMPQYFSLGYHQCRWGYKDQEDVLQVNQGFIDHGIPCDSITLDIDHADACRYFTWNEQAFPDPLALQKALVANDRQLITITDPHILVDADYHVYEEAARHQLYVRNSDHTPFVGKCWPGDCIYMDYLNEETRAIWASLYSYEKYKYSTPNMWAWNDMNEPSVFEQRGNHMPNECLHTFKTLSEPDKELHIEHREVHNMYGYGQNKATYEGMLNRNKDQNTRPFALSRSFFAGSQKYTIIWTGDTGATWEYLRVSIPQLLSLSICGMSFCGSDLSGFNGNPEPELAVRWHQVGIFMPFFRGHSEITNKRREPWMYPAKYAKIVKECIIERYRLLPYWYSCFEAHCRTAVPILRPIWFDQNTVLEVSNLDDQQRFMMGDAILVIPILQPNQMSIKGALKGLEGRWYDYHTYKEASNDEIVEAGLERIGCFVKGGSIVPKFDIKDGIKSSKDARESDINLLVGLDEQASARGVMYFDDGDTFDFRRGAFSRKSIEFEGKTLTWRNEEGDGYDVDNKVVKVIVMGIKENVKTAYLLQDGGDKEKVNVTQEGSTVTLEFISLANNDWKIVYE